MPLIIIIRGPAGGGKSTIAQELKERIPNCAHLDIDKLKHAISKESSKTRTDIAHKVAIYFLQQLIENEFSVIVEEVFRESYYKELSDFAKNSGCSTFKIFISAPLEVLIERDHSRSEKTKGPDIILTCLNNSESVKWLC